MLLGLRSPLGEEGTYKSVMKATKDSNRGLLEE